MNLLLIIQSNYFDVVQQALIVAYLTAFSFTNLQLIRSKGQNFTFAYVPKSGLTELYIMIELTLEEAAINVQGYCSFAIFIQTLSLLIIENASLAI